MKRSRFCLLAGGAGIDIALLDKDGDGMLDSEEAILEAKKKIDELGSMMKQHEAALVEREQATVARQVAVNADVAEMKLMLKAMAAKK